MGWYGKTFNIWDQFQYIAAYGFCSKVDQNYQAQSSQGVSK